LAVQPIRGGQFIAILAEIAIQQGSLAGGHTYWKNCRGDPRQLAQRLLQGMKERVVR
jgi:hypothetical protein